ncbi:hypothetical protein Tco_1188839, partial [Tanacetum coccineum]
KGTRKPNLGGRKAGRLHTRQETRNLGLKESRQADDKGPIPIRFEWDDKKTLMPLGDHASHWSNYLGELIKEMPLYQCGHPTAPAKVVQYQQGFPQGSAFGYKPQDRDVRRGEHQAATSLEHYPGRLGCPDAFWNDPRNQARAAQNLQNRAKSTVIYRQGSRSLARLRD